MLQRARIIELESKLAKLKVDYESKSLSNIKKLFYNTYGALRYDIEWWNKYLIDGIIYRSSGFTDDRPDEYFTLLLETPNFIIRFMYNITHCQEEHHYLISIMTDKSKYSSSIARKKDCSKLWKNIYRIIDIPQTSIPFEKDIIITMGNFELDYSFFYKNYDDIILPTESKFIPHKIKNKKSETRIFKNLSDEYAYNFSEENYSSEEAEPDIIIDTIV